MDKSIKNAEEAVKPPANTTPETEKNPAPDQVKVIKPEDKKNSPVYWSIAGAVLLAVIVMAAGYFFMGRKNGTPFFRPDSGKSKLLIDKKFAFDNFLLTPKKQDSTGVEADTSYILKSQTSLNKELIEESLITEPKIELELKEISDQEWEIIPKQTAEPNQIVKLGVDAAYLDENGKEQERDYSWAFQVKDTLKVLNTIPRQAAVNVPLDIGVEITLSYDNFIQAEKYLEISPKTEGKFEKHGRTLVFAPKDPLKTKTLYSITLRKGLPLEGSEEVLAEDYSFTFETVSQGPSEADQWFSFLGKQNEISTLELPLLQVSVFNFDGQELEFTLYKLKSWEDYLEALKERDRLPWWSSSKQDYRLDTKKLTRINSLKLPIKETGYQRYIEWPEKLPGGYYILEASGAKNKDQAWIEVTDISAYLNITKKKSIIWINDLEKKTPIKSAKVELLDFDKKFSTDEKGVAIFDAPEELVKSTSDESQNQRHYIKVEEGGRVLILPATPIFRYYYDEEWQNQETYWKYFYTDRPRYQTSDTIKFWGILKKRDSEKISEKVTATLYKEGYIDYYYQPVMINEQTLQLSPDGSFMGEIKYDNLRPDYYVLQLKAGDKVIRTTYLNIEPYVKPAYQLSIIPDKKSAYAGEEVRFKVQANFYEGTPVPGLKLVYANPDGEQIITTDDQGKVELKYTKKYIECKDSYRCWPDYAEFTVRPEASELADINSSAYVRFFGPKVWLDAKVEYTEKGMAEVKMSSKFIELTDDSVGYYQEDAGQKIAPNTKIEGELIKTTYRKEETGTYYDFITKKTYKNYNYIRQEEKIDSFSAVTDQQGNYVYRRKVDPDTSYQLNMKIFDDQGRYERYSQYFYYYNGNTIDHYYNQSQSYYHFEFGKTDSDYRVGEEVNARFLNNDTLMPAGKDRYLYLKLQSGLQEYAVTDKPEYDFKFEEKDIPNVNLFGVYFNGQTYLKADTGYYGRSIGFKYDDRTLEINLKTDRENYKPGEEVKLSLEVKDLDGKPKEAEVNINLIDEAYYAVAEDFANPLSTLYDWVSPGTVYVESTHYPLSDMSGGAEKGGCFLKGTLVLMADKSRKPIEKIEQGDKVSTYNDAVSKKIVEGAVVEVWQHEISEYLIINGTLKVTPEHQLYANGHFTDAGTLKIGDWLLNDSGEKITIRSLTVKHDPQTVYNLHIEPQNTYFAGGFYVHNAEKGGGPREYFVDAAYFNSVKTDSQGKAEISFKLPDNITSWRVTSQAISKDNFAGAKIAKIPVSLPVFEEVTIGGEYLDVDSPVARMRAFGTALTKTDKTFFVVKASSLGLNESNKLESSAFSPAFLNIPKLIQGTHSIIYELSTAKGNDSIMLPLRVIGSRLSVRSASSEKLSVDTKIKPVGKEQLVIVLSDQGQNRLYAPLLDLSYQWTDRVDKKLAGKIARNLLKQYYKEEIVESKIESANYQLSSGGITLLPYSSEELELSARIAFLGADDFDKESLAQYLQEKLEYSKSSREDISLALFGLASLDKPVLSRLEVWLKRTDLTVRERIYLALGLYRLGASQPAQEIYDDIMSKSAEKKNPYILIKTGKTADDIFEATALMSVLASALNIPEKQNLFDYVVDNQVLWGEGKNSENLFELEKVEYIANDLPSMKPSPAKVIYEISGKRQEVSLTGNNTYSFNVSPELSDQVKFLEVTGEVGISTVYVKPIGSAGLKGDKNIGIRREYYVNGKKTSSFTDKDVVEVRLYPTFSKDALAGQYQLTDALPSGLLPVVNLYRYGEAYDCNVWYPYNTEGQMVKFMINKDWKSNECKKDYISYFARTKTRGKYLAEPAILQSYTSPSLMNYSNNETINITQ